MIYTLSTNQIHLTPATSKVLDRRLKILLRHIPGRLKSEPLQLSIRENLAKNYVEGIATIHLPGKTLVAKSTARNIKLLITDITDKMRRQIINYKTLHDRSHSQFPDKQTIRNDQGYQRLTQN